MARDDVQAGLTLDIFLIVKLIFFCCFICLVISFIYSIIDTKDKFSDLQVK